MAIPSYQNGRLNWDGCDLQGIAERFGTPCHVGSTEAVRASLRGFRAAFLEAGLPLQVRFSVKTNPAPVFLDALRREGAGFEVVSKHELELLRRLGVAGEDIVLSGLGGGPEAVKVQLLQKEVSPDATGVYNANDIAVISSFSVEFDVSGGKLHLVVPYAMSEPIMDLFERSAVSEADARDNRWESALKENIQDAMVEIACQVAETDVSLREVIDLQVGDVIPIDAPEPILRANDVPLFRVRLGSLKGNLALQVLNKIQRPQ